MSERRYDDVLIDLSGVLYVDGEATRAAVDAVARLRAAGCRLCCLTNTTRRTRDDLVAQLDALGFDIAAEEILTAAGAARAYLRDEGLTPHLLVHPALAPEFADFAGTDADTVVVGDAGDGFTYDALNAAFRVLMAGDSRRLVAMGANRYFANGDALSLDMGPFVAALEFAASVEAVTVGKPAPAFFAAALATPATTEGEASRAVMIGDDLASDVGGAQQAGLAGVLVRTGKYRAADEQNDRVRPDAIVDDFAAAVDWILGSG